MRAASLRCALGSHSSTHRRTVQPDLTRPHAHRSDGLRTFYKLAQVCRAIPLEADDGVHLGQLPRQLRRVSLLECVRA